MDVFALGSGYQQMTMTMTMTMMMIGTQEISDILLMQMALQGKQSELKAIVWLARLYELLMAT